MLLPPYYPAFSHVLAIGNHYNACVKASKEKLMNVNSIQTA